MVQNVFDSLWSVAEQHMEQMQMYFLPLDTLYVLFLSYSGSTSDGPNFIVLTLNNMKAKCYKRF